MPVTDTKRNRDGLYFDVPRLIAEQMALISQAMSTHNTTQYTLNENQSRISSIIVCSIEEPNPTGNIYFVDGPGGTGKTYLFNAILDIVR